MLPHSQSECRSAVPSTISEALTGTQYDLERVRVEFQLEFPSQPIWAHWANLAPFGPICAHGAHWAHLGPFGLLGPFGAIVPIGPIGPIWAHLGPLGPFGPIWAHWSWPVRSQKCATTSYPVPLHRSMFIKGGMLNYDSYLIIVY